MKYIECDFLEWEFRCPRHWERLELTNRRDVRFCNACHENVYAVTDKKTAQALANEGKCIVLMELKDIEPLEDGEFVSEDRMTMGIVNHIESDPRLKKIDLEKKIEQINARMKSFGETPEQLARLKRLYSLLVETINEIENKSADSASLQEQ